MSQNAIRYECQGGHVCIIVDRPDGTRWRRAVGKEQAGEVRELLGETLAEEASRAAGWIVEQRG